MKNPHNLELECPECQACIPFSLFELDQSPHPTIGCPDCGRSYLFEDEALRRQLHLFTALCRQLRDSEEILSNTSISVTMGDQHVEVPYKLLLTRLNSKLRLTVGCKEITITFRMDTVQEEKMAPLK
jgi:hypothetical protein